MIVVEYRPVTGNMGDYDAVMVSLITDNTFPASGNLFHVAYDLDEGRIGITEVWESKEQWEDFILDLLPIVRNVGSDFGTPQMRAVHNIFSIEIPPST